MKLYETLPDHVVVGRRKYKVDLDFRNVLRMLEFVGQNDLMPEARDFLALKCVMRKVPRIRRPILEKLRDMLFDTGKTPEGKRVTDFNQDADYIRSAFLQEYGINLWRDKLHWIEFTALLAGLPEGSRYTEILGIRSRPIPSPTKYNKAERDWLIQAKARCALEMDEKQAAQNYEKCVQNVFAGLLSMAKRGGDHGG